MPKYKGGKRAGVYHHWGVGGTVCNEVNKEALVEVPLNKDWKKMRE